jgi:hypothetical protein
MSTKSTIFHNNKLHFYKDVFDEESVYLDLYDIEEASIQIFTNYSSNDKKNKITIKIEKKDFQSIIEKIKSIK